MKELVIKNGLLVSPANGYRRTRKDILVRNGRIAAVEDEIVWEGEAVDAAGCLVTPGFIDIHTHCYPKAFLGLSPDVLGIERGATAILDAGSSGADTYEDFRENYIKKSRTKVFTLLNVSKEGLLRGHELDSMEKLDEAALKAMVKKYPDEIVGLKARASASVVGEMGLKPIEEAARIAKEIGKPLMVHVGNYPPALTEVLKLLDKKDIVTHVYHGKKGGILTDTGEIIPEAVEARERGVLFDVGHGVASFSLRVFEKALAKGFDTDLISTDLHVENYEGPVYNLAAVVSKVTACGEPLEEAVHKCTCAPARHYGLADLGEIKPGYVADLNVLELAPCREQVQDSIGDTIELSEKLVIKKTIYSRGEQSEIFEQNP
ncbi:amidohydrolase/deacetylase family metallohydrolase [Candidatus Merdisoma sp. JLR.KK011]|uniref:amidohydrolase/deacetylase family metallohydrolase n=1 Tax=Candidatus Merdisoma sp. JLR.KK011 TaxID=3114299 RepID=UPI002FF2C1AB